RGVEEPRETADATDDLGPARLVDPLLHQVDGPVALGDRHARRCVAGARLVGHGRLSASAAPAGPRETSSPSTSRDMASKSNRCFPSSSGSGRSTGYTPSKQARQSWSFGTELAATSSSSEM